MARAKCQTGRKFLTDRSLVKWLRKRAIVDSKLERRYNTATLLEKFLELSMRCDHFGGEGGKSCAESR